MTGCKEGKVAMMRAVGNAPAACRGAVNPTVHIFCRIVYV